MHFTLELPSNGIIQSFKTLVALYFYSTYIDGRDVRETFAFNLVRASFGFHDIDFFYV